MKRLNKKGFTLVELLAVIVILAVLILLAMPSVLRIMENARKSAFETEVRSYLKAAQTKYVEESVNESTDLMCFSSGADSGCYQLDMDNKDNYEYYIEISQVDGIVRYMYQINNDSYTSSSSTSDGDEWGASIKVEEN